MVTSGIGRYVLLLIAALAASGCARVVDLKPPSASPTSAPPPVAGEQGIDREIERRLVVVEEALLEASVDEASAEARTELEAERLALVVALSELDTLLGGEVMAADELVTAARAAVARAREDADERAMAAADETLALATKDEEQKNAPARRPAEEERSRVKRKQEVVVAEKERDEGRAKASGKKKRCSPGDPLCSDVDGRWDVDLPPADDVITAKPDTGVEEPFKQGMVGAARVAYEPTPTGVMAEIRRHFGRVSACIGPELRQQELQLHVLVLLDERGMLRQPRVEGSSLDAVTRECVADVFRTMRVEDPPRGSRVLSVPLWLAAER